MARASTSTRSAASPTVETTGANVRAVVALERDAQQKRTSVERVTDVIAAAAGTNTFIVAHVAWFALWIGLNVVSASSFDRYPFRLLTLIVSLEAILLTSFVLIAQHRMTKVADQRTHLDLQVNLLAEQELTAILRVVCALAEQTGIDVTACDPHLTELLGQTNVRALNDALTEEMATADPRAADSSELPGRSFDRPTKP